MSAADMVRVSKHGNNFVPSRLAPTHNDVFVAIVTFLGYEFGRVHLTRSRFSGGFALGGMGVSAVDDMVVMFRFPF